MKLDRAIKELHPSYRKQIVRYIKWSDEHAPDFDEKKLYDISHVFGLIGRVEYRKHALGKAYQLIHQGLGKTVVFAKENPIRNLMKLHDEQLDLLYRTVDALKAREMKPA